MSGTDSLSCRPRLPSLAAGWCLGLCLAAWGSSSAIAKQAEADEAVVPATAPADAAQRKPVDPELKQKTLQQAFTMLAAIIIGGVLLLLIVVMWGNRTRRFARKPLPNVARRDELWFLKPKPAGSGPSEEEQPTDGPPAE